MRGGLISGNGVSISDGVGKSAAYSSQKARRRTTKTRPIRNVAREQSAGLDSKRKIDHGKQIFTGRNLYLRSILLTSNRFQYCSRMAAGKKCVSEILILLLAPPSWTHRLEQRRRPALSPIVLCRWPSRQGRHGRAKIAGAPSSQPRFSS